MSTGNPIRIDLDLDHGETVFAATIYSGYVIVVTSKGRVFKVFV